MSMNIQNSSTDKRNIYIAECLINKQFLSKHKSLSIQKKVEVARYPRLKIRILGIMNVSQKELYWDYRHFR